jgi:hypothetical protein
VLNAFLYAVVPDFPSAEQSNPNALVEDIFSPAYFGRFGLEPSNPP